MLRRAVKRARQRMRGRRASPPLSTLVCFRMRSARHLAWLTRRKRRHFFRLYRGRPSALAIWWQAGGFHVGEESGARQQFVPHAAFAASPLGRAIAEGRLYVLWDV